MTLIEKFAKEREIPFLVHFTNINNVQSIMENGLYPRDRLDELENDYFVNDDFRLDGHSDSISLSIAFPNSNMFYKVWKSSEDHYCLLLLHAKVLWELDCAFCKHNAADKIISSQSIDDLKSVDALSGLYEEIPWIKSRQEQKLKIYDPTDLQAEVLVFDVIDPEYIGGVIPIEFSNYCITAQSREHRLNSRPASPQRLFQASQQQSTIFS